MSRAPLLLIGVAVTAAAVATAATPAPPPALVAAAGAPVVVGGAADVPDPFPLARVRVTEEQLPDAAKALAPGPLTRLPRAAFEAKVQAAGAAVHAAKAQPRLVAAKYTTAASGAALAGTVEWTIAHAGRGPAVLPLDPLKLALRSPTWADGAPAAVGAFAGLPSGVGVMVPGPGRHVLRAVWTAAGTGPAAERTFDLRLPPCPGSVLDLDLGADRTPTVGSDVLLTGPLPGAPAGQKRWRLRLGEKTRVDLLVRGPAGGGGPVAFGAATRYDLAPGEVACEFDFDLRATREPPAEWAFTPSAGLRVLDVTVNNRAGWRTDAATGELRVALRQPAASAKVRVTAAAALPTGPGAPAALPTLRPVNGLPTQEQVELHVAAGLDLAGWEPGDYRVTDAATAADGARTLALAGTLLPAGSTLPARRPPSVRVADAGPLFDSTEEVSWAAEPGRTLLTLSARVRVRRGPLFRLPVRPPPGYPPGSVTTAPADLLGSTTPGPAGATTVDFARPLTAGQEVTLLVAFRGPPLPPGPVARLPFPAVAVVGAAEREGRVKVYAAPGWETLLAVPRPPEEPAPPIPDVPEATPFVGVRYHGAEPVGELVLASVRPAFASSVETRLDFTDGRLTATSVVRLDVNAGVVGGLAVFDPAAPAERTWKVTDGSNTIAAATPTRPGGLPAALALLGGGGLGPLAAASAAGRTDPGTLWLVRFSRPAEDDLHLETTAVLGAGLTHAEAARRAAAWGGLTVAGATTRTTRTDLPAALGGAPVIAARPEWGLDELVLTTECGEYEQAGVLRGVVTARGGRELPVRLPPGAQAHTAIVAGKAVDPASLAGTDVSLPVPAGSEPVAFELRYRLPRESRGLAWVVESPLPELPGGAGRRRAWAFGPGVAAAWPFGDRGTDAVVVVPERLATAAGFGLAALVGGFGWVGVRTAHRSAGFALLTVLAGAGVAVLAGPAGWGRVGWPVVAVGLPAAAAVIVSRGRLPRRAVAGVLVFVAAGVSAQTGGPDIVFVLNGADGESVLAPPPLLARLEVMAKPDVPAPVVVGAAYDGRVEDGLARVTATFAVQVFGPAEPTLQLPLADVRLERVTVNGAAATPAAVGGGRYAVPLPRPGRHAVEVRFAVPVGGGAGEREVKFGVPEVPDARLTFAAPAAARQVQAVGRFGEQKLAGDPTRVAAELGALKAVSVRWRDVATGAATVTVREGCVWDVSESGAVLTACYDIRAEAAAAASVFRFDLPAGLEPVRVAARGLDATAGAAAVQAWGVVPEKGGGRTLRVDLAAPADGRVLVTVECLTRAAPTAQPVLRFPRPQGMERSGGVYGLRPSGVTVGGVPRDGVIDFAPDALVREFGTVPELRLVLVPGLQAFTPRPDGPAPELRPLLRPAHDAGSVRVEAGWGADLRGATGTGSLAWSAAEPTALLEFALAARVREVRAAEMAGWTQSGERVQVWFRHPLKAAAVQWVADTTHDAKGAGSITFEPPLPRPIGPAVGAVTVRVRPADGLGLAVEGDKGWAVDRPGDGREWTFKALGAAAPVRVHLNATRVGQPVGFGLLDLTAKESTYRVAVDLPVAADRAAHAVIRVSGLPAGAKAELEPVAGARVVSRAHEDDAAGWNVDVSGPLRAVVAVRLPAGWSGPLPAVWAGPGDAVPGGWNVVRFVGRIGRPDIRLIGATPATPIEQAEAGAIGPGEVERLRRTGGELFTTGGVVELELPNAPPEPVVPPAATPPPAAAPPAPTPGPPPGSGQAAAWVGALLAVGVLFARLPRATWPEQAAALAALFGHAVAGVPFVGLGVYAAARGVWFADRWKASRASSGAG